MMAPILVLTSLTGVGAVAISGVALLRRDAQQKEDNKRRHYLINFPRDLGFESVLGFVRSLAGITVPPWQRLKGLPTIVFEIEADHRGIRHRMSVPGNLGDYVISQLRGQIPGVHITVQEDQHHAPYHEAVELSMSSGRVPLRINSATDVVTSILSSFMPLKPEQSLLYQWVVAPNAPETPDESDKAHKQKHSDHTFIGVGRIGARAANEPDARGLIRRVYTAISSTKNSGVAFHPRSLPKKMALERLRTRKANLTFPCLLNSLEVATLAAFSVIGAQNLPGLPQGRARHLAADPLIPREGIIIGMSNFPGDEKPLAITPDDLLRHCWVGGRTGTGKSTFLHNIGAQIMQLGYGMIVIEPKTDLVYDLLNSVPPDRVAFGDVIVFDASDTAHPIGLNILEGPDPERTTGHIVSLFKSLYPESWGPRLEYILRYTVLTAALNGLSLYDVRQLLLIPSYRRNIVRKMRHPEVLTFWQMFEKLPSDASDSVINKLDAFLGYSAIRNIVGQTKSGINLTDVVNQGKILLVPLPGGLIGDANASMLGSLITSMVWQAARSRAGIRREDRKPFFVILDEFQNYLNLPVAINDALAQARGYGVGMILANQQLAQLKDNVKSAVMGNARSKIVYNSAAEDARALVPEFAPYVEAADFQTLGAFESVVKLLADGQNAPPATAYMPPAPPPTGMAQAARAASRAAYGRPVQVVEAEFRERTRTPAEAIHRPAIGRRRKP